jgi:flagellar biosynthesis protein FlhF
MQVKKFEAPTIQEALDNVKRELGPEAIILQTKKNKRGFGLMSRASVEVTAAVSDRSMQKKQTVETRIPEVNRAAIRKFSAEKQADIYDKYQEKQLDKAAQTQDKVQLNAKAKKITATRYIDIEDDARPHAAGSAAVRRAPAATNPGRGISFGGSAKYAASLSPPEDSSPSEFTRNDPSVPTKMSLEDEVSYLKKMIQEMKASQDSQFDPSQYVGNNAGKRIESREGTSASNLLQHTALDIPALQDAFEQLVINGVDRRYVLALIKKVAFELGPERSKSMEQVLDLLADEIMASVEVHSPFKSLVPLAQTESRTPAFFAFVGPTGVGKTCTVAKLASDLILNRKLKVGLINLDSHRTAAFEQLGTYAKIIHAPFRCAISMDDFRAAVQDFQNLDVILVDTTGHSQRDPHALREMQTLLKSAGSSPRSLLVVSATTRDTELYDISNRFSIFSPQGIVISKLDEATVYGSIYNLSQRVKIPLVYFTTGQTIPGDIEEASPERVAALVMEI